MKFYFLILGLMARIKDEYIRKRYKFADDAKWNDPEDFLCQLATKMGKLLKGGNPGNKKRTKKYIKMKKKKR
tara:strand:+ start:296 stop:511 length:216 start_codon:yes stop_codon:yes gene_type:complete